MHQPNIGKAYDHQIEESCVFQLHAYVFAQHNHFTQAYRGKKFDGKHHFQLEEIENEYLYTLHHHLNERFLF